MTQADTPAPFAAIEQIREGLVDGCSWACGCDYPGNPSKCIHADRFAALGLLTNLANTAEKVSAAEVAWISGTDHDKLRAALVRVRTGQTP